MILIPKERDFKNTGVKKRGVGVTKHRSRKGKDVVKTACESSSPERFSDALSVSRSSSSSSLNSQDSVGSS